LKKSTSQTITREDLAEEKAIGELKALFIKLTTKL